MSDLHGCLLRGEDPHSVILSALWEGEGDRRGAAQVSWLMWDAAGSCWKQSPCCEAPQVPFLVVNVQGEALARMALADLWVPRYSHCRCSKVSFAWCQRSSKVKIFPPNTCCGFLSSRLWNVDDSLWQPCVAMSSVVGASLLPWRLTSCAQPAGWTSPFFINCIIPFIYECFPFSG